MKTADEDLVPYRGGDANGNPLGRWFTREPPASVAKVRIDNAVKEQWIDPRTGALTGTSPVDAAYKVNIPEGTTYCEGPVGSQGGVYAGGMDKSRIFIDQPWTKGATVLDKTPPR